MDESRSQLRPRHLGSAAVIFERKERSSSQLAIHTVLVSDVKEEGGRMYCHYEVAVTLSRVTEHFGCESTDFLQGTHEGPKTWCMD